MLGSRHPVSLVSRSLCRIIQFIIHADLATILESQARNRASLSIYSQISVPMFENLYMYLDHTNLVRSGCSRDPTIDRAREMSTGLPNIAGRGLISSEQRVPRPRPYQGVALTQTAKVIRLLPSSSIRLEGRFMMHCHGFLSFLGRDHTDTGLFDISVFALFLVPEFLPYCAPPGRNVAFNEAFLSVVATLKTALTIKTT
jgi:hypothetical protein